RGRGQAPHRRQGAAGRLRLRRQDHVRQEPELSRPARPAGALRPVERTDRHLRSGPARHQGVALPDAAQPQRLHRLARGADAALGRAARLDPRRQAEAAHGVRVPAQGRRRGASRAGRPQDHGEGLARAMNLARWAKWAIGVVGALVLLIVVALIAVPYLVDTPRIQAYIASNATQTLGRPVKFSSVSLRVRALPAVEPRALGVAR